MDSTSREPFPGELDKLFLEAHVDSLKDEFRELGKAYDALVENNTELRGRLRRATTLLERFRDCRKYGVGMPMIQGDRLYLDADVDAFLANDSSGPGSIEFLDGLARSPVSAIEALREIASRKTDDPVLANMIAGIRHGLELADKHAREKECAP